MSQIVNWITGTTEILPKFSKYNGMKVKIGLIQVFFSASLVKKAEKKQTVYC
jgi:hypothetical protein